MNFFTRHLLHPWGLLALMHLCCPRLTPPIHPLSPNTSPLEILGETEPASMKDGVPTSSTPEGTCLLHPNQIFVASMNPLTMMTGKVIGREISSATGGRIHIANYAKHLAIQPFTVLNFSTVDVDSNLVQIWR